MYGGAQSFFVRELSYDHSTISAGCSCFREQSAEIVDFPGCSYKKANTTLRALYALQIWLLGGAQSFFGELS